MGATCPEPALLAWGQQALSRIQENPETRRSADERHLANEDESDHGVIGRLIRRMRISEPPRHFQALATNVLKASLGMAAVAWIPGDSRDEIVVSGSIEGLRPSSYRDLIPAGPRDTAGGRAARAASSRPGLAQDRCNAMPRSRRARPAGSSP